ncbi:MAG: LptA/OstA family protein [Myxococcota bacterium]
MNWVCVALVVCGLAASGAAAQAPSGEAAGERSLDAAAERIGLSVARDAPLTIVAEELEAARGDDGRERVVFRKAVRVEQGTLTLHCDYLEAIYPASAGGQPETITARGAVRITQDDTEVRCAQAVFRNAACSAVCTSAARPAQLRRGENIIEGREIHFDLCSGRLKVRGGQVHLPGAGAETSQP